MYILYIYRHARTYTYAYLLLHGALLVQILCRACKKVCFFLYIYNVSEYYAYLRVSRAYVDDDGVDGSPTIGLYRSILQIFIVRAIIYV